MVDWQRYPQVSEQVEAKRWLQAQEHLGLSANTIDAYGRAVEDYFRVCIDHHIDPLEATLEHVALFVHSMRTRKQKDGRVGLANATIHQRLTGVRLYYAFLVEEGIRQRNPVGYGHHNPISPHLSKRGIVHREKRLPWIPTEEQWQTILEIASKEILRNRVMLAFAYDAALRREELCSLRTGDIDPSHRTLHIRPETTKTRRARVVPYSFVAGDLYQSYLNQRRHMSRERGALFLSESNRNQSQPISIWTWSKVVHRIAQKAGIPELSTHTFRHLCLTDLARTGWDIHEIASFAGHSNPQTTLTYIHLSATDLSNKFADAMSEIHTWRMRQVLEVIS